MKTEAQGALTPPALQAGATVSTTPHVLIGELAAVWAWLRERELWLVLLLGVLIWAAAYQVPYRYILNFGGDPITGLRNFDRPFLTGWNKDPESATEDWRAADAPPPFRWAYDHAALRLPGIGVGSWRVSILAAGQPTEQPTKSVWSNGVFSSTVVMSEAPRVYQHLFAANQQGDLALSFETPAYAAPNDPRLLGFLAYNAVVQSVGWQWPPWSQLGWLVLLLGMIYGVGRRLGAARRWVALGAFAAALLIAVVLALWRIELTSFAPALAVAAFGCYPLAVVLLRVPVLRLPACGQASGSHAMIALVLLAFMLRIGGLSHPYIIFSDIGLNANNLLGFESGQVYQKEGLPARAGGGDAPYPTGQYIVAAPLQLLYEPDHGDAARVEQSKTVLKIVVALLDSLVVAAIWLVLRRSGFDQLTALFAAALYVLPTSALKSFSVGEFANLAGQALAIPLLVALALVGTRLREPRTFALLLALMLLALLGHSGVTISVVLLLSCFGLIWLFSADLRRNVLLLIGLGVVAAALLGLFFHSALLHLFVPNPKTQEILAALPERTFLDKLGGEFQRVFGEPHTPISPLMMILGLGGVVLLGIQARSSQAAAKLWPLILAWWGSVFLSLGALLVRDQTVRWDLFLYPALCVVVGLVLAALWRRGRTGQLVAGLFLTFLTLRGLIYWIEQIRDYLH